MSDLQTAYVVMGEAIQHFAHIPVEVFEEAARSPEWSPTNLKFAVAALAFRRRIAEIMGELEAEERAG